MTPRILLLLPVLLLAGCASTGAREGEGRFVGYIDQRTSSFRHEEPSMGLFALGLTGLLVRESMKNGGVPVFHYVIKSPEGDVNAEVNEAYAVGDCVDVSGPLAPGKERTFAYGEASIVRSSQCP